MSGKTRLRGITCIRRFRLSNRGDSTIAVAVIGAGAAAVATFVGWIQPQWSEQTALVSEAGYLCNAMSWQAFYIASAGSPENWRDAAKGKSAVLDRKLAEKGAFDKPLIPLRTPVWSKLKDKVGDLGSNSEQLTGFFNRVEFLNAFAERRKCFNSPDTRFSNQYLCTLGNELSTCAKKHYGRQNCFWLFGYKVHCRQKDDRDADYRAIAARLLQEQGVCAAWGPPVPTLAKECEKSDSDKKDKNDHDKGDSDD